MSQLKNDRLLRAIFRQPVDATPIWIMRQAGRYLPEYRKTREQAGSFMALCKTPALACEVTLQPIRRFDLDAAIIFSDILTIPDAMGLGLHFKEGEGPIFERPVRDEAAVNAIQVPDPAKLSYVYEAIQLVQQDLAGKLPLIGFCGSPWTLAVYMIEGKAVPGFPFAARMLAKAPLMLHNLLDKLAESVGMHLQAQVEAGANVVMIFDTWGGLLECQAYEEFSLFYIRKVIQRLKQYNNRKAPVILFTKGGDRFLEPMANSGCDVVGIDWETSLKEARARVGGKVALQGNLNPTHLLLNPENLLEETAQVLQAFGHGSGHIFNLGHGITPDVPPEHVQILIDAVHELSQPYHRGSNIKGEA